ncbi:MAG: hypothetical protein BWZ10_01490 [candidate division BRC1 bacterium ADurb.BinA364]|nr:MAG: hypothetical protein BWZ10_01490 [candidate division BRC1 bacterium ADurb.BinA364]
MGWVSESSSSRDPAAGRARVGSPARADGSTRVSMDSIASGAEAGMPGMIAAPPPIATEYFLSALGSAMGSESAAIMSKSCRAEASDWASVLSSGAAGALERSSGTPSSMDWASSALSALRCGRGAGRRPVRRDRSRRSLRSSSLKNVWAMVRRCSRPDCMSEAEISNTPSALMKKVTRMRGAPARAAGISERMNLPSERFSLALSLSPCRI